MTLRRRHHDVHDEELASFVADVRASVPSPPGEETAQRHLAAMRAAAAEASVTASGAQAPGRAIGRNGRAGPLRPLRLGAALAGAVVAFGGTSTVLAAAGVELPDPVRAPFEAVGIDLPNQPGDGDERDERRPSPVERERPAAPPVRPDTERDDVPRSDERRGGGRSGKPEREAGRSDGRRRDDAGTGRPDAPGRSEQAPGRSNREGSSGGATGGPQGRGTQQRGAPRSNSGGPARPSPSRSADRGAGPSRPVKPAPSDQRPPKARGVGPQKQAAPPATEPGAAHPAGRGRTPLAPGVDDR